MSTNAELIIYMSKKSLPFTTVSAVYLTESTFSLGGLYVGFVIFAKVLAVQGSCFTLLGNWQNFLFGWSLHEYI